MKNLYSGFKKVSEDDQYAILEHENGHKINIAKSGLDKKLKKQLEKLPLHQAKGTDPTLGLKPLEPQMSTAQSGIESIGQKIAEDVKKEITVGAAKGALATDVATGQPVEKFAGGPSPEDRYIESLSANKPQVAEIPAAPQKVDVGEAVVTDQQPTLAPQEVEQAAVPQEQPVEGGLARIPAAQVPAVEAPVEKTPEQVIADPKASMAEQLEAQNALYQKNIDQLRMARAREREVLPKIDPNRMFKNQNLFQNIINAAALIAGGYGAGLSGGENVVMRAMNDAMERDIEAQKQDQVNTLNLYRLNSEAIKDEMSARLQTMANMKMIMAARMEEEERKYNQPLAKQRLQLARMQIENDIDRLNGEIAQRKTVRQIKQMVAAPGAEAAGQLSKTNPSAVLPAIVPDEKLREKVQKEISRRQSIVKNAPKILESLEKSFEAYKGLGQLVGRVKEPEAVKDLELKIRGIIPEQEGDVTGQQREAKVQALLNLLKPGPSDVFDKQEYTNRLKSWLQENVETPASDQAGINLNQFESTAIRPETWGASKTVERMDPKSGRVIVYDAETKKPLRYK